MVYNNLQEFLIDNRHGFINELKEAGASGEVMEVALDGYDFLAMKYIESETASEIELEQVENGKNESIPKIADRINKAQAKYIYAVKEGKRVGYSACDDCDDPNDCHNCNK